MLNGIEFANEWKKPALIRFEQKQVRKHLYFVYTLLFVLLFLTVAQAAFEFKETGARGVGLSGAFSARATDATAPFWNPAALRLVPQIEITSFYSQLFSVSDLAYLGGAFAAPTPLGGVGLAYSQFGPTAFREQQLYISHGFELANNLFAGYNLKGMFLKIDEFGSASTFGFDAGVLARITESLNIAAVGKNLNRPTIGAVKESLPTGFVAGAAFQALEGLWLSGDFERIDPNPVSLKSGFEFMMAEYFTLRGGIQNNPARFTAGFGTKAGIVRLDYAYQQQGSLSANHQVTVSFKFGEPKEEIYRGKAGKEFKGAKKIPASVEKPVKFGAISPTQLKQKFTGKVNLSTVTVEDLAEIEGVGLVTANKIVEYRDRFGIKIMDDILKAPGMRKDIFNVIKQQAYIQPVKEGAAPKAPVPPLEEELPPLEEEGVSPAPAPPTPVTEPAPATPAPAPTTVPSGKESEEEILLEPEEYEKLPAAPAPAETQPSKPTVPEEKAKGEIKKATEEQKPVPRPQEKPAAPTPPAPPRPAKPNLNRISPQELSDKGLTSQQIKNILRYRAKKGGFKSLDELKKLPGIDAETFEKLKENVDVK